MPQRAGAAGPAGGVEAPGSGAGRPIFDQVSQTFERLLQQAGVKLDAISDPGRRLIDRVSKMREALANDPGLLERLKKQDPGAFRQLQQFRDALEAMLPSLSGAELDAANLALRQIDTMLAPATTMKPIVPPSSQQ